jgi:hypothetical protein
VHNQRHAFESYEKPTAHSGFWFLSRIVPEADVGVPPWTIREYVRKQGQHILRAGMTVRCGLVTAMENILMDLTSLINSELVEDGHLTPNRSIVKALRRRFQ